MSADRVVVSGFLVRCPLGGYAWQVLHYLAGLRQLGLDPYFFEDTSSFPGCYDPRANSDGDDPSSGIAFAEDFFPHFGFGDRWAFHDVARNRSAGLRPADREALWADARIVISLAGVNRLPPRRRPAQRRAFIDLDPAYTQIQAARGDRALIALLGEHDVHFTFGENVGQPTCRVPTAGFTWQPTRQPIALALWQPTPLPANAAFTTIGRWDELRRELHFDGETFSWRKRIEWMKFLDLPRRSGERFLVAMDVIKRSEDLAALTAHGWQVCDPIAESADALRYRDFIRSSKGEFTVAKDLNVRLATGWFSDRAACYLAAGRPVVTQDTGFGRSLPTGTGLFAVRDLHEAVEAVRAIASNYAHHAAAARAVAEEYFDASVVLRELLSRL